MYWSKLVTLDDKNSFGITNVFGNTVTEPRLTFTAEQAQRLGPEGLQYAVEWFLQHGAAFGAIQSKIISMNWGQLDPAHAPGFAAAHLLEIIESPYTSPEEKQRARDYLSPQPSRHSRRDSRKPPRPGTVYILAAEDDSRRYKIGHTRKPAQRLGYFDTKLPFAVNLHASYSVSDPLAAERHLHERFRETRLNGEWFELTAGDLEAIEEYCETQSPEGAKP